MPTRISIANDYMQRALRQSHPPQHTRKKRMSNRILFANDYIERATTEPPTPAHPEKRKSTRILFANDLTQRALRLRPLLALSLDEAKRPRRTFVECCVIVDENVAIEMLAKRFNLLEGSVLENGYSAARTEQEAWDHT